MKWYVGNELPKSPVSGLFLQTSLLQTSVCYGIGIKAQHIEAHTDVLVYLFPALMGINILSPSANPSIIAEVLARVSLLVIRGRTQDSSREMCFISAQTLDFI